MNLFVKQIQHQKAQALATSFRCIEQGYQQYSYKLKERYYALVNIKQQALKKYKDKFFLIYG